MAIAAAVLATTVKGQSCDAGQSCGICLVKVTAANCPSNPNIGNCHSSLSIGTYCEGDNECDTNNSENNCGAYDVYERVAQHSPPPSPPPPAPPPTSTPTASPSPAPFELNGVGYFLVTTEMPWADAEYYCAGSIGGHLASYHNASDQAAVFAGVGAPAQVWNGLNDKLTEDVWVWTDGSAVDFTAWGPGEPNGWGSGEDCGENDATVWNDAACSNTQSFICQLALPPTITASPTPPQAPTFPYTAGAVDPDALDVVVTVLDGKPLSDGKMSGTPANGLVTGVLNGNFDNGGSGVPSEIKNRVMSVDEHSSSATSSHNTAATTFTALMLIGCMAGLLVVAFKFAVKKREFEPLLNKDQNDAKSPIVATQVYGTTVAAEAGSLWLSEDKEMGDKLLACGELNL